MSTSKQLSVTILFTITAFGVSDLMFRSPSFKKKKMLIYFAFFWFNHDQIFSRSCIKFIF